MKSIAILTLFALISGFLLASIHTLTQERIIHNELISETKALAGLVDSTEPEFLHQQGIELVYTEIRGYGGTMKIVVAFREADIHGVRVLRHGETPGFSDVLLPTAWIKNFSTLPLAEVDAVSGATITTNAVLRAVKDATRTRTTP